MRNLVLAFLCAFPLLAQTTNEVIVPTAAAARVLVPVAGNTPGANGTHFRTDIHLINLRNVAQRVQIFWYPEGVTGSTAPVATIDLPAQRGTASEDFVSEVLQRTGIGALEFVGVHQDGTFDAGALLHVATRIWTPRPDGAAGTMSQTFPALIPGAPQPVIVKAVFGMRRGAQYRLNAGVFNPASTTQRFRITAAISGPAGLDTQVVEIDVPARSIRQITVAGTSTGVAQVLIEDLGGGAGDWQGWASSVDNQSGDAWSQIAVGG